MKRFKVERVSKHHITMKAPVKTLMKVQGKFLHGTQGKPTRGPRGNKR